MSALDVRGEAVRTGEAFGATRIAMAHKCFETALGGEGVDLRIRLDAARPASRATTDIAPRTGGAASRACSDSLVSLEGGTPTMGHAYMVREVGNTPLRPMPERGLFAPYEPFLIAQTGKLQGFWGIHDAI